MLFHSGSKVVVIAFVLAAAIVFALPSNSSILPTVRACDPSMWAYYGSDYTVGVSASADKTMYAPGDTAVISGTVMLQQRDVYYQSACDPPYEYTNWTTVAVSDVAVNLEPSGSQTTVGSNGGFTFNVQIPQDAKSGSTVYTVTATHTLSGSSNGATVSINVQAYSPAVSVTGSGTYYPGDTIVFAGAGWAPDKPVTIKFLGLQQDLNGPAFSGEFVIPDNAAEGALNILATQEPNLQATTTVTVQWRSLTVSAIAPGTVRDGGDVASSVTVTGTVASNNGPVTGATISVVYSGEWGSGSVTGVTDSAGNFAASFNIPPGTWAHYHFMAIGTPGTPNRYVFETSTAPGTISVTASKAPGYKSPSNTVTIKFEVAEPVVWGEGMAPIVDFGIFSSGSLFTVSVIQAVALQETAATTLIFTGVVTSLTLPIAVAVVSGGVLVSLLYYRYRNAEDFEGARYWGKSPGVKTQGTTPKG